MDLRVLASGIEEYDFPTVVTLEDITVSFFNDKFRELVPETEPREPLGKYMKVKGISKLIKEPVAPCVAEINGKNHMCAYCRVASDFETNYSFSVAVPGGDDGNSLNYLTSKLAVLSKCELNGRNLARVNACPPLLCDELKRRIDGCLEMSDIAYNRIEYSGIEIIPYMKNTFEYYSKLRYGTGATNVHIESNIDVAMVSSLFCIEFITLFHFASKASRNGRIIVTVKEEYGDLYIEFTFRTPKRFAASMFDSAGETNEKRIYSALGFEGSDLIYAQKLALESKGRIRIRFDGETVKAKLFFPNPRVYRLRAPTFLPPMQTTSRMIARILLNKDLQYFIR